MLMQAVLSCSSSRRVDNSAESVPYYTQLFDDTLSLCLIYARYSLNNRIGYTYYVHISTSNI